MRNRRNALDTFFFLSSDNHLVFRKNSVLFWYMLLPYLTAETELHETGVYETDWESTDKVLVIYTQFICLNDKSSTCPIKACRSNK